MLLQLYYICIVEAGQDRGKLSVPGKFVLVFKDVGGFICVRRLEKPDLCRRIRIEADLLTGTRAIDFSRVGSCH